MTEEIRLSPREQEILRLFDTARSLSIGFGGKSREELLTASKKSELSTPLLNICQAFAKTNTFTDKDLFILNYISAALKRSPADFAVSRLHVNEEYIAEAYKDAMSKYAALTPDYKAPCNISRLLSLGSEALSFGAPRSYSLSDVSLFAGTDTAAKRISCAVRGYFPADESGSVYERKDSPRRMSRKISSCQAAIIYTREPEKASTLEEFFNSPDNLEGACAFASSPDELFVKLLALDTGVTVNADALPNVNLLPNLPNAYRAMIKVSLALFDNVVFGDTAVVVIAPSAKLGRICTRAIGKGLTTCRALSFKRQSEFSVTSYNQPVSKLPVALLKAIREMIGHGANIKTHSPASLEKETHVEKIFEDEKGKNAAYRTSFSVSDSPAPYHEALYSTLALILSAARDGFNLRKGDMRLSVRASLSLTDQEKIGAAVAAILGIYRIETEFCVPEENSTVEYASENSEITVCLRAHSNGKRKISEKYSSIDPLLFSSLDENGIPDLTALRDFAYGRCFPDVIRHQDD